MTTPDSLKQNKSSLVVGRTPGNPRTGIEHVQCDPKASEELGATALVITPPLPPRPCPRGSIDEVNARRSTIREWVGQGIPFTEGRPHPTDSCTTEELEELGLKGYTTYCADGTIRGQTNL